jgi:hypothetical protein
VSDVLGWYVHHHGRGHLHRAQAVARELDLPVTGLSSLPRPEGWTGDWVHLAPDDPPAAGDPTAGGRLHWVPTHHPGLSRRTAQVSAWLDAARPRAVVVDVSVEVTLLVRLHGVPVVGVVLPGRRDDPAHRLGLDVSDLLVGAWPDAMTDAMLPGLAPEVRARVHGVGALSRHPVSDPAPPPAERVVTFLGGAGGHDLDAAALEDLLDRAAASTPEWTWEVAGPGRWHDDVAGLLRRSRVVVTHAGQNALAEVAAARRPAVVVPQLRPHREQHPTAAARAGGGWPGRVLPTLPEHGWPDLLEDAARRDGSTWDRWCDGGAAARMAALVRDVA